MQLFLEVLLDEQLRRNDVSSGNSEVDELVAFARELKKSLQPDPIFAIQLEYKLRMHASLMSRKTKPLERVLEDG